jgi:hypothetical protein
MLTVRNLALLGSLHCVLALDLGAQRNRVEGSLLPRGVDTFHVSYAGNRIGRGILARVEKGAGANKQLLQVYSWRGAGGDETTDSLFMQHASLRPLREVRIAGDTIIEVRFQSDSATVSTRYIRGSAASQSFRIGRAYSSASLDAVVAAAPLSAAYTAQGDFYYAPPSTLGTVRIAYRVIGSERIRDRGSDRDTWVLAVDTPDGGTTFWIDKTSRSVVRFDTREGNAVIEFRR